MSDYRLDVLDRKIAILNSILHARPNLTLGQAVKAAEAAYAALSKSE